MTQHLLKTTLNELKKCPKKNLIFSKYPEKSMGTLGLINCLKSQHSFQRAKTILDSIHYNFSSSVLTTSKMSFSFSRK